MSLTKFIRRRKKTINVKKLSTYNKKRHLHGVNQVTMRNQTKVKKGVNVTRLHVDLFENFKFLVFVKNLNGYILWIKLKQVRIL